jgi:hypothetical protein
MCFEDVFFSVSAWFTQGFTPHLLRLRMYLIKQHVLIKQVMQVAVRAPYKRRRFEPTCMIVNSIHLRGLHD